VEGSAFVDEEAESKRVVENFIDLSLLVEEI
jgi:hypothetical protein